MKLGFCLVLAWSAGAASASLIPVSVYDFDGTLDPFFNANGLAQPIEGRQGGSTNTPSTITFEDAVVNGFVKKVANFDKASAQFFRTRHGMLANGGFGARYVNQYTLVMDLKVTSTGDWVSLFNTNANNANDGDYFIRNTDSALGISGVYSGFFPRNQWVRLAIVLDLNPTASSITSFVDGVQQARYAFGNGFEGRWAAYAANDPDGITHIDLLADNDGENGGGQISMAAFYDRVLTNDEVAALGSAGAPVPEPATLAALAVGAGALLRRRRR